MNDYLDSIEIMGPIAVRLVGEGMPYKPADFFLPMRPVRPPLHRTNDD